MHSLLIAHLGFVFGYLLLKVSAYGLDQNMVYGFDQGCDISRLTTKNPFGYMDTYYLVNRKYGTVQRSTCSTFSGTSCLALASQSQDPIPFVIDAYSVSYGSIFLREANRNGSYITQNGNPVILMARYNSNYNGAQLIHYTSSNYDYDSTGSVQLKPSGTSGFCTLIYVSSYVALSAQYYQNGANGQIAQLVEAYPNSQAQEQQWSFVLATDIDAQFKRLDSNGNGVISLDEYINATDPYKISELKDEFDKYDNNSDGFVSQKEEIAYDKQVADEEKDIHMVYFKEYINEFDANNDTKLQSDELKLYLASKSQLVTRDSFSTSFAKYDKNGDKGLDIDEFYNFLINIRYEVHNLMRITTTSYYKNYATDY